MTISKSRGYYGEARIAKKVNGVIVGRSKFIEVQGKVIKIDHQHPVDVVTPVFGFESKYIRGSVVCSKGLSDAMLQAETNAYLCEPKLTPVCAIKDAFRKQYYYVTREQDFIDLLIGGK